MDVTSFAIWKFRTIEGLLRNMHASDMDSTKYVVPGTGETTWIRYDMKNDTAKIVKPDLESVTCTFGELPNMLRTLGMYDELPEDCRHHLAGQQKQE